MLQPVYAPVLVTPPAATPISLDEAKAQCRVDGTDEDALITALTEAATSHLDGWSGVLGRALVTQTWRQDFDAFDRCLRLPLLAASISSVKVRASDGTLATIASSNYSLKADALGSYVRFKDAYSFPTDVAETQAVMVEFVAGYGAAAEVPADIRHAIKLLVGHWYANREAVNVGNITTALPMAVDALIAPHRRVGM